MAALEGDALVPPARVGQLAQVAQTARMRVDAAAAWEAAVLNTPITTGSAVATEISAPAEVRMGSAVLRLAPDAQVVWREVGDTRLHMDITSGMVTLRVRALASGEQVLLSAGGVTVQVLRPGSYRLRQPKSGTRVVFWVQEGQARMTLNPQDLTLGPDQHAIVDRKRAVLISNGGSDEHRAFDDLVEARDRRNESSFALLHVSAEMTGVEALDGHGSWRNEAGYGSVWFPDKLPLDWAPYRHGRWRWLAPWGWTWIDDAAWGFAPFHYGRWLFAGGRWGWVPGTQATTNAAAASAPARPVFAPALVGFFGTPASALWTPPGASAPAVGWYPLAPGEMYWPGYSSQAAYVRALNAASVSDTLQIQSAPAAQSAGPAHRFARTSFAASAMPYAAFSSQQDVLGQVLVLNPLALAQAPLSARRLPPPGPALAATAAAASPTAVAAPTPASVTR